MTNEIEQELIKSVLVEKRRDRRWRNIRAMLWILIVLLYAYLMFGSNIGRTPTPKVPYASLVRLNGLIMPNTSFSAQKVIPLLDKAFADKKSQGVILLINSPGGSPVQASIIHDRIITLKKRYHKKVVVVGEDALASGSYLVATAADKIFVNPNTLTGSIGVIFSGFGFVDLMNKVGIQRRVLTAGTNKDRLDPFMNTNPEDVAKVKNLLDEVHQSFINDVIAGRGDRLKGDKAVLFSGDFWTGQTAVQLGLADGTANLWEVARKEFNAHALKDYSARPSLLTELVGNVGTELNFGLNHDVPVKEQAF